MSYILEALKRSEYARQQGKVPTLDSLPSMMQPPVEPPARHRLPCLLLAGLLLALAIGLAWWRTWPAAEQIRIIVSPHTTAPAAAASAAPPQRPALPPEPPAVAQAAPPAPVAPPQAAAEAATGQDGPPQPGAMLY